MSVEAPVTCPHQPSERRKERKKKSCLLPFRIISRVVHTISISIPLARTWPYGCTLLQRWLGHIVSSTGTHSPANINGFIIVILKRQNLYSPCVPEVSRFVLDSIFPDSPHPYGTKSRNNIIHFGCAFRNDIIHFRCDQSLLQVAQSCMSYFNTIMIYI